MPIKMLENFYHERQTTMTSTTDGCLKYFSGKKIML